MTHSIERLDLEAYTGTDPQDHEADTEDSDTISGSDLHHDPWLIPASTELKAFAEEVFDYLEGHCPRPARQRSDAMERRKAIVENILANVALLVHHRREGSRLFSKGVPALPMHDGLMCPASQEEVARREMARASLSVVGVALPVGKKEIERPNS